MPLKKELAAKYIDDFTFSKEERGSFLEETPVIDHIEEDEDFYYGYQMGNLIFRLQKTESPLIGRA